MFKDSNRQKSLFLKIRLHRISRNSQPMSKLKKKRAVLDSIHKDIISLLNRSLNIFKKRLFLLQKS